MKEASSELSILEWATKNLASSEVKSIPVRNIYFSFQKPHRAMHHQFAGSVHDEVLEIFNTLHGSGVNAAIEESRSLEEQLRAAFGAPQKVSQLCNDVLRLEAKVDLILKKLNELSERQQSILVPIETLTPEPYEVLKPFTAVLTYEDEGFVASVFDASIFASGDTEEDALANLKATIIDTYERLNELRDDKLGPVPLRQKQILSKVIRKEDMR